MSLKNSAGALRFSRGIFLSLTGATVSQLLALATSIFAARILGKIAYGELGILLSTLTMFSTLVGFSLGSTATKHLAQNRDGDLPRAGRLIGMTLFSAAAGGILLGAAVFASAPYFADSVLNGPHLTSALQIGALMIPAAALYGTQIGALSGFEAFGTIAVVNICGGAITLIAVILGAFWGELSGAVWGYVVAAFITWTLGHLALRLTTRRAGVTIVYRNIAKEIHALWEYSLPATLAHLIMAGTVWLGNALLVNQPDGYAQMALFGAANQWRSALTLIPGIVGQTMFPILANALGFSRMDIARKTLRTAILVSGLVVVIPGVVLSSFSPSIMGFYGQGFQQGWVVLIVCLLTGALISLETPVGYMLAASGRMWLSFIMTAGWSLTFVIAAWMLVPLGALGLAIAYTISYMVNGVWITCYGYIFLRSQASGGLTDHAEAGNLL
ncbi:MAG: oligosaccharide flippase family protein [Desulfomonilaceae bacterium]